MLLQCIMDQEPIEALPGVLLDFGLDVVEIVLCEFVGGVGLHPLLYEGSRPLPQQLMELMLHLALQVFLEVVKHVVPLRLGQPNVAVLAHKQQIGVLQGGPRGHLWGLRQKLFELLHQSGINKFKMN